MIKKPVKIELLTETGAIFASALKTDEIDVSKHQEIAVVLTTDAPVDSDDAEITATPTLTVCATDGTTDTAIPFELEDADGDMEVISATGKEITIGKNAFYIIHVDADTIGKLGLKDIVIKTTAVASCTIKGTLVAILLSPRYSD